MRILHQININGNKFEDAYDIHTAYKEHNELSFRKYKDGGLNRINAKIDDIVYLYIGEPVRKIMYKCIITDDNSYKSIGDEKYFLSNNHKRKDTDEPCYILKKLQCSETENLNFYNLKKFLKEKTTSIRCDYTDKNLDNLKRMFDYIEDEFSGNEITDLQNIKDEFKNMDDEFNSEDEKLCDILPKYKEMLIKQRIGQGKWREYLIKHNHCKCVLCDIDMKELLIASHIKEYSKCEKNTMEHVDKKNGLLLCANHDKLFDNHLISFDVTGKIMISDKLPKSKYGILGILGIDISTKISTDLFDERYMAFHRNIYIKL